MEELSVGGTINARKTINSVELAELTERRHYIIYMWCLKLLKDNPNDFTTSTYKADNNKTLKCFLISQKGCMVLAQKHSFLREKINNYWKEVNDINNDIENIIPKTFSIDTQKEIKKPINTSIVLGKEFNIYGTFDEPLFLAKDVASWIEHSDVSTMIHAVDDDEKVQNTNPNNACGGQGSWFLTENGLYEVLMQSRKPIAKEFKKEVKKILHELRTKGVVDLRNIPSYQIKDPIKRAERWIEEQKEQQRLALDAEEKEKHIQLLVHNSKTYTTSEIAKELGFTSASKLNILLFDKHIQYKVNDTWVLYSNYSDKGLTSVKQQILDSGKIIYDRRWTGDGRDFIINLLNK